MSAAISKSVPGAAPSAAPVWARATTARGAATTRQEGTAVV